jgi:hypothetical protein
MTDWTCLQTATLLSDGRVLITGGTDGDKYLAAVEIFDPKTGKFTRTGSMKAGREDAQAVLLTDGRVLIMGGDHGAVAVNNWVSLASAEIYDPATGKFTSTGSMSDPRTNFSATLLSNGKVLVAGGAIDNGLASADLYDPGTGKFTPLESWAQAGASYSPPWWASPLRDGRVLFAGCGGCGVRSAVYDPATGTFSPTAGELPLIDAGEPAVTLRDGRVLIPGIPSLLYLP